MKSTTWLMPLNPGGNSNRLSAKIFCCQQAACQGLGCADRRFNLFLIWEFLKRFAHEFHPLLAYKDLLHLNCSNIGAGSCKLSQTIACLYPATLMVALNWRASGMRRNLNSATKS
jgi:hypothetical protein